MSYHISRVVNLWKTDIDRQEKVSVRVSFEHNECRSNGCVCVRDVVTIFGAAL